MGNRLVFGVTVMLLVGCKSTSQTPGDDGGPPDTASDHMMLPEINLGNDAADARDGGDARADVPPACTGPKCPVVLATDTDPGCCIVADGNYVYWVSNAGTGYPIRRVPTTGGTPESIDRSDFGVSDMAIKAGVLYWVASDGIYRHDLASASGSATKIASGSPQFSQFGVNSSAVFWADVSGSPIHKTPAAGGTTVDFAMTTQAQYVAADETNVYWSDQDLMGGSFVMAPVGGGTPTVVATDLTNPGAIAVDGTNVYYANSSTLFGTKFWKMPRTGGAPVMFALSPDFGAYEITVDATDVYWAAYNEIGKAPLAGGAVTTVASGQFGAMDIAVDATNVYWLNSDSPDQAIMKLAK
jgi:hypothetical protein